MQRDSRFLAILRQAVSRRASCFARGAVDVERSHGRMGLCASPATRYADRSADIPSEGALTLHIPTRIDAQSPQPLSRSTDRFGEATPYVVAFFRRLRRIPVGAWSQQAASDPHAAKPRMTDTAIPAIERTPDAVADSAARARLREIMDTMPDVVRRIRQRIDHEVAVVDRMAPRATIARMRRATRLAACAIAARPWLTPDEFDRLYRPFAEIIPADSLDMPLLPGAGQQPAQVE